jgi:hypothetical protein
MIVTAVPIFLAEVRANAALPDDKRDPTMPTYEGIPDTVTGELVEELVHGYWATKMRSFVDGIEVDPTSVVPQVASSGVCGCTT